MSWLAARLQSCPPWRSVATCRWFELLLLAVSFAAWWPALRAQVTLNPTAGASSIGHDGTHDPLLHPTTASAAHTTAFRTPAINVGGSSPTPAPVFPGSNGGTDTVSSASSQPSSQASQQANTSIPGSPTTPLASITTSTSPQSGSTESPTSALSSTLPRSSSQGLFTTTNVPTTTVQPTSLSLQSGSTSSTASLSTTVVATRQTSSVSTPLPSPAVSNAFTTSPSAVRTTAQATTARPSSASLATSTVQTISTTVSPTTITTLGRSSPAIPHTYNYVGATSAGIPAVSTITRGYSSSNGVPRPGVLTAHSTTSRLTTEVVSAATTMMSYREEATLLSLLTVICAVTGMIVLLMLVYLIYRQNKRFHRARAANRRPLGAVNRMFFNADVEMGRDDQQFVLDPSHLLPSENQISAESVGIRSLEANPTDATSGYSSSRESLDQLDQQDHHESGSGERNGSAYPTVPVPANGRQRAMTNDSGCEQGAKEDLWESGLPHVSTNPTTPITTQLVYTNINSESDLDLDVDRTNSHPAKSLPAQSVPRAVAEQSQPSHSAQTGSGESHLQSKTGTYDCQPVVNADGIVVRTARFPSKTSSQLSGSSPGNSADRLMNQ